VSGRTRAAELLAVVTLTAAALTAAGAARAATRAESALECGIAADMAVVAHSLAREQIQRQKADIIMARIYDVSSSQRAQPLYSTCMKSGGDMDSVLGRKL
jgi:hypothetical protein